MRIVVAEAVHGTEKKLTRGSYCLPLSTWQASADVDGYTPRTMRVGVVVHDLQSRTCIANTGSTVRSVGGCYLDVS